MADTFFNLIGDLAKEVKKYPIHSIIARRVLSFYEDDVDYTKYKFLCPFHNDKHSGNFDVGQHKYRCYACGEEGNAITFVMKFDNKSFPEATIQCAYELDIIDEKTYQNLSKGKASKNSSFVKREIHQEKPMNDIANKEDLHLVYSLFSQGLTWLKKPKLSEQHYNHLKNDRNLSDEDIAKNGYFTFPSIYVLKHILKKLKELDYDVEILKHIPGFFYDNKKEKFSFMLLKGNSGIGIPIKDEDGYIVGIQIRLDTVNEGEQRYIWFSSKFANNKDLSNGTSPGTPISVFYPDGIETTKDLNKLSSQTIFITEGHFKARKLAKTFNSIALSVQGVHNWREIPYLLDRLKKCNPNLKHLYVMFDADMSYKESVLQPAIKLGLSLTNLDFKDCKQIVEQILSINLKQKEPLKNLYDGAKFVENYLRRNAGVFKFNIVYCLWDDEIGKGIDDYLDCFENLQEAILGIKKIQLIEFWSNAYSYLLANDNARESIALRDGIDQSNEVVLSEEIKKDNFMKSFALSFES